MRHPIWNEVGSVPIGSYQLDDLPGCTQVVVSHAVSIRKPFRGSGNGKRAHLDRLDAIGEYGYDYAIWTVEDNNEAQKMKLADTGWHLLDQFDSTKTGNTVNIYGRRIPQ